MNDYDRFLESKRIRVENVGFDIPEEDINPQLFPFQRAIVRWALRRGRAAIFADCGLGKTPIQLEWAKHVSNTEGRPVLIFAPLAVSHQTKLEGEKFHVPVTICATQADVQPGVNISNYEKLHHFTPEAFAGLVLDESSILKAYDGKTRKLLQLFSEGIHYRMAATATPAPNDLTELCNHAEFLSVMLEKEVKALFFTQDGNSANQWRLKGHAKEAFWKWMASWSVACRKPSDLGFEDDGFILPKLTIRHVDVCPQKPPVGWLFHVEAKTMDERRKARRDSTTERVASVSGIIQESTEPWVIWCDLNVEQDMLETAFGDRAISVYGTLPMEEKERRLFSWLKGERPILISKPSICGWGINMQRCANVVFVGLSDSYEQLYQAIRRCWRFGQKKPVTVHIVAATTEGAVVRNIEQKELQAREMMESIVREMAKEIDLTSVAKREEMPYREDVAQGNNWTLYLGDCVSMIKRIDSDSIGLSVFSPPFPGMYTYTNSPMDMGNTRGINEMMTHFYYLIPELLRVVMPGRSCCVHLTQATAKKGQDGYIGLKDFRGRVIEAMESAGWVYYGEVCIDKDPQVKAIRTKDQGLLFKTLAADSSKMHMAMADYILQFRKPGDNPSPIKAGMSKRYRNTEGWITDDEWIEWAAPVWYRHKDGLPGGIRETDVLNVACAREEKDERHLCPLQLGVIERCVKLWSAPGELVLSPFAGIGSEGYQALKFNRRFVGIELKESYWKQAQRYLQSVDNEKRSIMDLMGA